MKTSSTVVALAVALIFCTSVQAQQPPQSDVKVLSPIIVEGEESASSASQNVTVLTADVLEEEMAQSMEDAIRYIPGVSMVDFGRFGHNGFNIRGLEGDRVSLTVDGLSFAEMVETAPAYEFFRAGRGEIDIDALKRVEIIKGADAITAGSGALGGAVMFTTKDPADFLANGDDTYLGLKYGYTGSANESMGSFTFANRTGAFESMLVYTHREGHETEGWYDGTIDVTGTGRRAPDPLDTRSNNVLAKLGYSLASTHRLGLVFERARSTNDLNNLSRVFGPAYLERYGHDTNDRDRYGLEYRWTAGNLVFDELEIRLDRQQTESRALTTILAGSGCPGGTVPCLRTEDRMTEQVLDRAALDFTRQWQGNGIGHSFIYGIGWQQRDVDFLAVDTRYTGSGSVANVTVDPSQVPKTDVAAWNVYLRDTVKLLNDRLTLNAGARFDRFDYSPRLTELFEDATGTVRDVSFSAPTWQFSARFEFVPEHSLWAQVGRGFRAPSVADMYAPTSTTTLIEQATGQEVTVWSSVANPALEAERSLNTEIGYRWETNRVQLGLSFFRDEYSNFIEDTAFIQNPDTAYLSCSGGTCTVTQGSTYIMPANFGEVTVRGAELEGRIAIGRSWQARLAYTHNEGEKRNGDPLESINPDRGVLGLRYAAPSGRWHLTGNLTHSLAKKMKDAQISPGIDPFQQTTPDFLSDAYTVVDLFGGFNFSDRLRIQGGVYNLFDEKYYLWSRIRLVNEGPNPLHGYVTGEGIGRYSEPGRNVRLTMSYQF